jgi:polyhydroxybutyrate depolymerase
MITFRAPLSARVRWAVLLLGALLAITGCSSGARPGEFSTTTRTLTVGGLERSFTVSAPTTATPGVALPLLIMLHGAGGDATGFANLTGMIALAERNSFVVVYPNGTQAADEPGKLSWNAGACCGVPSRTAIDDVAFVDQLIDEVDTRFQIDPAQVYAAGFSNGGMLSYRLACELGGRFAGIADVGGSFLAPDCAGAQPAAALIIHGTADDVVPYNGGPTSPGVAARYGMWSNPAVSVATAAWASTNGCAPEPAVAIAGAQETSRFVGCVPEAPVELVTIAGGSHSWPTESNGGMSASQRIVEFFGLDQ